MPKNVKIKVFKETSEMYAIGVNMRKHSKRMKNNMIPNIEKMKFFANSFFFKLISFSKAFIR